MMSEDEITNVGDAESQQIPSPPVLCPSLATTVPLRQLVNPPLLLLHVRACSLENQSHRNHLFGIESKRPGHQPFLDLALQLLGSAGNGFQRLAKLKLQIVYQPHACRRLFLLREVVHERETVVERLEDDRAVALFLRQREKFYNSRGNDSEAAFASDHPCFGIEADTLARDNLRALELPRCRDHRDVEENVLDVSILILLHAAGVRRDPAAEGRKLDAVGLVAHGQSVLSKLRLNCASRGAGLNLCHAIHRI